MEPVSIAFSIRVDFEKQVVLLLVDKICGVEVAWLKVGMKPQNMLLLYVTRDFGVGESRFIRCYKVAGSVTSKKVSEVGSCLCQVYWLETLVYLVWEILGVVLCLDALNLTNLYVILIAFQSFFDLR